jgi:arylamine N-acetyltransferase
MIDVEQYLTAIGYSGPLEPDLATLTALHERHVRAIPYRSQPGEFSVETLADLDWARVFERSIVKRMGGNCFELNEPFRLLLEKVGFRTHRLAASTRLPDGRFGPEIEHQAVLVELDADRWLVDVGHSEPTAFAPLKLTTREQLQDGLEFRMARDGEWWVLERKSPAKGWVAVYRFRSIARELADWNSRTRQLISMAEIPVLNLRIISRVVENTTITMIGRRLLTHNADRETTRMVIAQDEYDQLTDLVLDPSMTDTERAERVKTLP